MAWAETQHTAKIRIRSKAPFAHNHPYFMPEWAMVLITRDWRKINSTRLGTSIMRVPAANPHACHALAALPAPVRAPTMS